MKPASISRWNLPDTPDPLSFVIALIENVVLVDVLLGPVAFAVFDVVFAPDQKLADHVPSFARHDSLTEVEMEFHCVAAGPARHQEEALPRARGKARIGLRSQL